jgi:predicted ATPase
MPISRLTVEGYRSILKISLKLKPINVLVGPNGCGKTNLYRGIYLLAAAANGQFARALAEEGGMPSVLWAGPRGKGPVRMTLGVEVVPLTYTLGCGLPQREMATGSELSKFILDPQIKEETITFSEGRHRATLLERKKGNVWARDAQGTRVSYPLTMSDTESALAQLREPHRFPQVSALRQETLNWRFYHQFRTDADSPIRQPQVGVRTPVLSSDGRDLAAALQTIHEIGDGPSLQAGLEHAFPGARLQIEAPDARFRLALKMPGFNRPFEAQELSDGTLRYLCLLAALLSPRPPSLLALNEPETSIHPDLIEPMAALIVAASRRSQLWVTTHSQALADHIERASGVAPIQLQKIGGITTIVGQGLLGGYAEDDDE